MANQTFPKDLSKKIINEFIGDCNELLPDPKKNPFNELCEETIQKIFNLKTLSPNQHITYHYEVRTDIYNLIRKLKDIVNTHPINKEATIWEIYINTGTNISEIGPILDIFYVQLKLIRDKYRKNGIDIRFTKHDCNFDNELYDFLND